MPATKNILTATIYDATDVLNTIKNLINQNSASTNTLADEGSNYLKYTFPSESFTMEMELNFNDYTTYCQMFYTLSHNGYQRLTGQVIIPGTLTYGHTIDFNCYCSPEMSLVSFIHPGSNSKGVFGWIKPEFKPSQLDTSIYPWGFIISDEFTTNQNQFVSVFYTPYTQSGYSGQQIKNVFDSWLHGTYLRYPDPQHGGNIDVLAGLVIFKPNDRGIAAKTSDDLGIANVGELQGFPQIDLGSNGIYDVVDDSNYGQRLVVRIS